jgi:hypothetical protein
MRSLSLCFFMFFLLTTALSSLLQPGPRLRL